jgi:hypothetical protein
MKRIVLLLILLFLFSCSYQKEDSFFCSPPYFEWKAGECCLDENDNKICDADEKKVIEKVMEEQKFIEEKKAEEKSILSSFLDISPDNYWFQSYNTGTVLVFGDKRRSYVSLKKDVTDIYWDLKEGTAFEVCDINEEISREGKNFQSENAMCHAFSLNIRKLSKDDFEKKFPFGPVDWMLKLKDKKPILVETSFQTIGVKSIGPVIHFLEDDGSFVILKFDYHRKVPIIIDFVKDKTRIGSIKYVFDTDFRQIGILLDPEKKVIMPEEVPVIKDPVLIIVKETETMLNNDVYVKGKVVNQGQDYLERVNLLVECFDKEGELVGSAKTSSFEGITKNKDTDFKAYISTKGKKVSYCTARLR